MPARDIYHDIVKAALIADGWTITDDPYLLEVGEKNLYIDLGAEHLIAADKQGQRIAVEVKSFLGPSEVRDLEVAPGSSFYTMIYWRYPNRNVACSWRSRMRHTTGYSPCRSARCSWRGKDCGLSSLNLMKG